MQRRRHGDQADAGAGRRALDGCLCQPKISSPASSRHFSRGLSRQRSRPRHGDLCHEQTWHDEDRARHAQRRLGARLLRCGAGVYQEPWRRDRCHHSAGARRDRCHRTGAADQGIRRPGGDGLSVSAGTRRDCCATCRNTRWKPSWLARLGPTSIRSCGVSQPRLVETALLPALSVPGQARHRATEEVPRHLRQIPHQGRTAEERRADQFLLLRCALRDRGGRGFPPRRPEPDARKLGKGG